MIELIFILWVAVGTSGFWETIEGIRQIKEFKWMPTCFWAIVAILFPVLWITLIQIYFHPLSILIFGILVVVYMGIMFSRRMALWYVFPTIAIQIALFLWIPAWHTQNDRFYVVIAVEAVAVLLFLLKQNPNWAMIGIGLWILFKPFLLPHSNQLNDLIDLFGLFIPLYMYMKESSRRLRILFERGHDPLTGLMNRMSFNDWLTTGNGTQGAMILIDLDDFKYANDTYGHQVGDRILKEVGKRISEILPTSAKAYRWGGDEFVIVFPHLSDREVVAEEVYKLREHISSEPFKTDQHIIIQTSIGVAFGELNDDLFNKADIAMLEIKRTGKSRIGWYQNDPEPLNNNRDFSTDVHLRWVSDSLGYLMEHSSKGFMITDHDVRILDVNPTFERMSGYAKAEVLGKDPKMFASPYHMNKIKYAEMFESLEKSGWWKGILVNKRSDGNVWRAFYEISTVVIKDKTVGYWALVDEEEVFDLEEEILNAMERQEFHIYLQPQCLYDGTIVGAEALIRWLHMDRGLIPPVQFIPVAEAKGLIIPIGYWILQEVCGLAKRLLANGFDIPLAINLSPVQFHDRFFIENIQQIMRDTDISPDRLVFEVSERTLFNEEDGAGKLALLQQMGFSITLDRFGTGRASLADLNDFSITRIKIDQALIRKLNDHDDATIDALTTTARAAQELHLNVVAKGVESNQQLDQLRSMGYDAFQGYRFSQAVPAQAFIEALVPLQTPNAAMVNRSEQYK